MNNVLITVFSTLTFLCSAVPLTVHEVVQLPTLNVIKQELEAQGGLYTPQVGESVHAKLHEILKGNLIISHDTSFVENSLANKEAALQALGTVFSKTNLGKVSTKALSRIQTYLPAVTYAALAQGALQAWQQVHTSIRSQQEKVKKEDAALKANLTLRVAQHLATDIVINLTFLLYCPEAHPCERMYSLYLLNTLDLLGSQGLALRRHISRTNRFYFESDGRLLKFDPSKNNNKQPKRLKSLMKFLRTICKNEQEYRSYLKKGRNYGITSLSNTWSSRESTFAWHYAAGLFKAVSTIDVIDIRTVGPEKVFSHKSNSDFLRMMILCSLDGQQEESWDTLLDQAKQIMEPYIYNSFHNYMERYYNESLKRFKDRVLT